MKETLHIQNFGPIKDVKLELGKVNVLIGDQGTGKSTVAKLLSVIRQVAFLEIFDKDGNDLKSKNENEAFLEYLNWYGIQEYLKDSTTINYSSNEFTFQFINLNITYKEVFSHGFERLNMAAKVANDLFIPTERIYLSSLADSVYSLQEVNAEMPKVYLRFGNSFNRSRKKQQIFDYTVVLKVKYKYLNGNDIIIINDQSEILLKHASSAIQGIIPLLTVLYENNVVQSRINYDFKQLNIIEEPELNLFPSTQNRLINDIILNNFLINSYPKLNGGEEPEDAEFNADFENKEYKNQLLLTTHSPYILTSLNNLMYAYTVGLKHKEEVSKVIEEKYWLNPDDVSAYMLEYDEKRGGCVAKNILDEKEGLIDAENIDGVSSIINEEFNKLINIEIGVENETN